MDFFGQQADARLRSLRLLCAFAAALLGFLALLGALPALAQWVWSLGAGGAGHWEWDWRVFSVVAGGAGALFAAGAAIEWLNFADGGAALATRLGAEPLPTSSRDEAAHRLRNIVDEMAIASGRPAPRVFVLRGETVINALTAGHRADDAVLIVTRGCLDRLTRDELQGVVAHEFSHLLHGDTVLDARLVALLSGFLLVPDIGIDLLRAGWSEGGCVGPHRRPAGPTLLLVLAPLGLLLVVLGYGGFLLARALQSAAARQREFLADASAVQFTRNPAGLAGALAKIAASSSERFSGPAAAAKLGHLHFAAAQRSVFLDWFPTHPALAARLAALDHPPTAAAPLRLARAPLARSLADLASVRAEIGSFVGAAVTPDSGHLTYSQRLLASLPPAVVAAARSTEGAPAVVLGLLLSRDPARHPTEIDLLRRTAGPAIAATLSPLSGDIVGLHRAKRLPLLGLALGPLQALPDSARGALLASARTLAEHDAEVSLFEFALLKALERRIMPVSGRRRASAVRSEPPGRLTIATYAGPIGVLISACARASVDTHEQAHRAFTAGAAYFASIMQFLALLPAAECGLDAVSTALDKLATAPESYRRVLLAACARTVSFDRQVSDEESELARAVADALDCPLPPLIGND